MKEYEDFKSRPGELSVVVKGIDLHDKIRWTGWRDQHEAVLPLNNKRIPLEQLADRMTVSLLLKS